jgi:hypothetical protein
MAGTYQVTATEQATGLADTADVTSQASPPSGTGDLEVTTATTGENLDPDGYTVTVDGTSSQPVGITGSVTFTDLAAGDHSVELGDIANNCTVSGQNPRDISVPVSGIAQVTFEVSCGSVGAPYPPSPVIGSVTFDFSTHDRRAPGSDNWPITWAANDHQYSSWGDGGGFGGSNSDGRVSLGIARVEGDATSYSGSNVWGGKNPENPATFEGKSYGIISIDGTLYLWVSPGTNITSYTAARLHNSTDLGASWTAATWQFTQAQGIIFPTFLQFGRDYAGARDGFVYIYATELKDASALQIQRPGEISLMRVPVGSILDESSYEFFAGSVGGTPVWTADITARRPVFEDANGTGWTVSVSYNGGLDRYLLITEHDQSLTGHIGIFDAPEPWGPWTTVLYEDAFGTPDITANTFFWNFSNKWLSPDGKHFTLVLSGVSANDSWNTVRGSFTPK